MPLYTFLSPARLSGGKCHHRRQVPGLPFPMPCHSPVCLQRGYVMDYRPDSCGSAGEPGMAASASLLAPQPRPGAGATPEPPSVDAGLLCPPWELPWQSWPRTLFSLSSPAQGKGAPQKGPLPRDHQLSRQRRGEKCLCHPSPGSACSLGRGGQLGPASVLGPRPVIRELHPHRPQRIPVTFSPP